MNIKPNEKEIIGKIILENSEIKKDKSYVRIEWLVKHYLKKVGVSKESGAWEILYQDPFDGRYWLKTYPQSEMHGGGPPALIQVNESDAKTKYRMGYFK